VLGVDRRTVVVGLASLGGSAAILLSGCGPRAAGSDVDSDAGGERTRADEDERLVDAALRAEFDLYSEVERTRRRHRSLRVVTEEALAAHRAHVVLLSGTISSDGPPGVRGRRTGRPIAGRPAEALAALSRLEGQVAAEHVRLAMAARSGALARVLASMAAASAQLELVLAQASPGAGAGNGSGGGG
jgi:hypothetical protein